MAGRYPGAADIPEFWRNLRAGRDAIGEVPAERWDWRNHVDPERKDRTYTRWGGFIADADKFDPLFFGITPREAKLLDPQQRVFIEAAWAALEDAGYTRQSLKAAAHAAGGDVGVFAGAMHTSYRLLGMDAVAAGQLVQSNHWSIANRVSYLFDFTGPSLTVDTACSASLAAIHLACESLRRGECGAAIAGGVSLILHPQQPLELSRAGMLSKGPHNSAFGEAGDEASSQGEGVGVVLLKPLAAAIADGDRIHAVIRGSAMNAGGKTSGYTVPNPHAQAEVVEAALRRAGVSAESIGYVECHGTGTSLGDPIEIAGLGDAFRRSGHGGAPCAIGSVKSNIGHLESAAGIAGLTKVLLQLAATPSWCRRCMRRRATRRSISPPARSACRRAVRRGRRPPTACAAPVSARSARAAPMSIVVLEQAAGSAGGERRAGVMARAAVRADGGAVDGTGRELARGADGTA